MRFRLGGWAVAAVLVLTGCGVDGGAEHASPADGGAPATELVAPELVSARDTLPPAPPSTTSLTVLLTHDGDADDPGLDAAAAALAERPDIRVVVAVPGASAGEATTMSGFPVTVVAAGDPLVGAAIASTGVEPDLVVVGIRTTTVHGGPEPTASAAAATGVPALVVEVEDGDAVDLAATAMQLLEVLDLELDALLDEPAAVHRLTVPSCRAGSLRGRLAVRATPETRVLTPSDCLSTDRTAPDDEQTAVATGHASLARLP